MPSARELRIKLGLEVGFKPTTMLKKNHPNSIYGYWKGRFLVPPKDLHTINLREMRIIIAAEAGFSYDPDRYENQASAPFDTQQLQRILEKTKATEDKRASVKVGM